MGTLLNRRRYMGVQKQEKVLFEMYNQYFNGTVSSVVDTGIKLWDDTHNSWKMEVVYQKLAKQANLTALFTVRPDYSPYSGIRFRKVNSNDIQLTISDTWSVIANEGGFDISVNSTYGSALQKTELLDYNSLIIIRNGNTLFIDFNGYKAEVLITNPLTNNLNLLIGCDYKSNDNQTQRYYTGTVQKFVITELPATYDAEVEYLQSSGTQWIDSGIECTSDLKVEFTGMVTTNVNAAACGVIANLNPYFRHHWTPYTSSFYWIQYNNNSSSSIQNTVSTNTWYNVVIDPVNGTASINGTAKTFTAIIAVVTTGQNYFIFARKSGDGGTQSRPCRFKSFKMWRNNILLRDFIAVRVGTTGYMYDKVSKQLFGNAGTGSFTLGPDKT